MNTPRILGSAPAVLLLTASLSLLGGCVIDARDRDTLLEPVRSLDVPLAEGQTIDIRIPAAMLTLRNSSDDRIHGQLRVLCPDLDSHCARKLEDLDFEVAEKSGALSVRLNRNSSWRFRNGNVEVDLELPVGVPVHVDMTAGALDAVLDNCFTADVEAGDVDVTLPRTRVRSVDLDAGVGEASLTIDGRTRRGKRSWLVGAEARWEGGSGDCPVAIDLQTGDLRLAVDSF